MMVWRPEPVLFVTSMIDVAFGDLLVTQGYACRLVFMP